MAFDFFGRRNKLEVEKERELKEEERRKEFQRLTEEESKTKKEIEEKLTKLKSEIESDIKNKELIEKVFSKVIDPEMNVDIWTLGLIYNVKQLDEKLDIKLTFTSPMCPFGPQILDDISRNLKKIGYNKKDVNMEVVFDPPWTPTQELRDILGV